MNTQTLFLLKAVPFLLGMLLGIVLFRFVARPLGLWKGALVVRLNGMTGTFIQMGMFAVGMAIPYLPVPWNWMGLLPGTVVAWVIYVEAFPKQRHATPISND